MDERMLLSYLNDDYVEGSDLSDSDSISSPTSILDNSAGSGDLDELAGPSVVDETQLRQQEMLMRLAELPDRGDSAASYEPILYSAYFSLLSAATAATTGYNYPATTTSSSMLPCMDLSPFNAVKYLPMHQVQQQQPPQFFPSYFADRDFGAGGDLESYDFGRNASNAAAICAMGNCCDDDDELEFEDLPIMAIASRKASEESGSGRERRHSECSSSETSVDSPHSSSSSSSSSSGEEEESVQSTTRCKWLNCSFKGETPFDLMMHIHDEHVGFMKQIRKTSGPLLFGPCMWSGCRDFNKKCYGSRSNMITHMAFHHGYCDYFCRVCNKRFLCGQYVSRHVSKHHPNVKITGKKAQRSARPGKAAAETSPKQSRKAKCGSLNSAHASSALSAKKSARQLVASTPLDARSAPNHPSSSMSTVTPQSSSSSSSSSGSSYSLPSMLFSVRPA